MKSHQDDNVELGAPPWQRHWMSAWIKNQSSPRASTAMAITIVYTSYMSRRMSNLFWQQETNSKYSYVSIRQMEQEWGQRLPASMIWGIMEHAHNTIYWQSLRFALEKFSPNKWAMVLKMIYRHLPTQEMLYKQGWVAMAPLCPHSCLQTAETNAHVYCRENDDAFKARKGDWVELWKQLWQCYYYSTNMVVLFKTLGGNPIGWGYHRQSHYCLQ